MGRVDWRLSVAEDLAREVDGRASEGGDDRDDFVSHVLRVGLDHLASRQAVQPKERTRRSSRARRARGRRGDPIWPCPRDWDTFDTLVRKAEDLLAADPLIERDEFRRELAARAATLPAEDPAGVVEQVIDTVLGPPDAEYLRASDRHRPPE